MPLRQVWCLSFCGEVVGSLPVGSTSVSIFLEASGETLLKAVLWWLLPWETRVPAAVRYLHIHHRGPVGVEPSTSAWCLRWILDILLEDLGPLPVLPKPLKPESHPCTGCRLAPPPASLSAVLWKPERDIVLKAFFS